MKVGTVRFVAQLSMLAWIEFVVFRMILLLFPTMTLQASILVWTTIFVVVNELSRTPICTLVLLVNVKLGFSSKILPVVSKDTLVPLMVVFVIRTPDSLEVKHVEVRVLIKLIDEFN